MSGTIFARASGSGRTGVAVYRISGPLAGRTLQALTGKVGRPRYARRVEVRAEGGDLIDDGLALWFPGPNSFTGEDVAELQLHGSPAVEHRLSEILGGLGIELAGAGAFTWRAFLNGKIDLTQAEGLADLLEAETSLQHRQAMEHYRGGLRAEADTWRVKLVAALASLEAAVDFPDEDDVPDAIAQRALPLVGEVRDSIAAVIESSGRAQRVAEGVTVALIGPPNAGKSTLFNWLLREERAIVSPEPGTTRDHIDAIVAIKGHRVRLVDTAGVRQKPIGPIESEGIRRAETVACTADLRVLCFPAGRGPLPSWLETWRKTGDLVVRTKSDLEGDGATTEGEMTIYVRSGVGTENLMERLQGGLDSLAQTGLAPGLRQRQLLVMAQKSLDDAERAVALGPEVLSETIRSAGARLEELTGRIAPDDVLADIFSTFCIGK